MWLDSTRDPCDSWLDSTRALISVTRDSTRDSSQVTRQQLCQEFPTALYDVRASWLSSTSAQFFFSSMEPKSTLQNISSTKLQFQHQESRNSSFTELNCVPSSYKLQSSDLPGRFSHTDLSRRLPWDSVRIWGWLSRFFGSLWGNYLAPNLSKIWVPRNSAHSLT